MKPPSDDQRRHLAADLAALAAELEAAHAPRVLRSTAELATPSVLASANGGGGGGGGGSQVEARALSSHAVVDLKAVELLNTLHRLSIDARAALLELRGRAPNRPVALYPCGHPIDRDYFRCQVLVDGVQCGQGKTERRCDTCDQVQPAGRPLRRQIALDLGGREVHECDRCRRYRERKHRSWGDSTRLAHEAGLIEGNGTYVTPAPPAEVVRLTYTQPWPPTGGGTIPTVCDTEGGA